MHDMNNSNSNKYFYKPYNPRPNNQHHRSHHQPNVYDNSRNDYYNGPPGYMCNNTMMPNAGYNHFSTSYPPGGNGGQFYRDFRQTWQPQPISAQPHRPMPPPIQHQQPQQQQQQPQPVPISQGQSSIVSQPSSSSSSIQINRNFTAPCTTSTSTSSSSSSSQFQRTFRPQDDCSLTKLKQTLAATQKELSKVTVEKTKLEAEEQRLQKIVERTELEIGRLETRARDPRVKSRTDSDQSLAPSLESSFSNPSIRLNPLQTSSETSLLSNSVPICSVQNSSNATTTNLTFSPLTLTTPLPLSSQNSTSTTSLSGGNATLILSHPSIAVSNNANNTSNSNSSNNSNNNSQIQNNPLNGAFTIPGLSSGPTSLLAPPQRNLTKAPASRGKQLNNLVLFKNMPLIFDVFPEEVLKPEIYSPSQTKIRLHFTIKGNQLENLRINPHLRVLLRICYVKPKKTSQNDRVSRKLMIKINNKPFSLGKQTNGSIKAPLDITNWCTETRNELELCWPEGEPGREYGVGIFINQRFGPDYALKILKTKDYLRPSEDALRMVIKNFAASGDICSEEIMVPLTCPITKKRLEIPAIGIKCEHLLCFDAKSFLDIHQKRNEWHCPSCRKAIGFNDLRIDCLISEILGKAPPDCLKVSFDRHGKWLPVIEKRESDATPALIDVNKIDIITLDDSDEENMKSCENDGPGENVCQAGDITTELGEPADDSKTEEEEEDDEEDDDEDDDETEEEDQGEDDDDDDDDEDEDDDDDGHSNDNDNEEEEEGEITDRDGSDNCGRYSKNRRYEDDPDFVYSGSRERKKKQLFEIFGSSDPESRDNSPDSSVQSPVTRTSKRRSDRSPDRSRSRSRKGRRK